MRSSRIMFSWHYPADLNFRNSRNGSLVYLEATASSSQSSCSGFCCSGARTLDRRVDRMPYPTCW